MGHHLHHRRDSKRDAFCLHHRQSSSLREAVRVYDKVSTSPLGQGQTLIRHMAQPLVQRSPWLRSSVGSVNPRRHSQRIESEPPTVAQHGANLLGFRTHRHWLTLGRPPIGSFRPHRPEWQRRNPGVGRARTCHPTQSAWHWHFRQRRMTCPLKLVMRVGRAQNPRL